VPGRIKQVSLILCLFLFLLVVLGGGLHLSPSGAFLAAATGTPLVIHFFNRQWSEKAVDDGPFPSRTGGFRQSVSEDPASHVRASEIEPTARW